MRKAKKIRHVFLLYETSGLPSYFVQINFLVFFFSFLNKFISPLRGIILLKKVRSISSIFYSSGSQPLCRHCQAQWPLEMKIIYFFLHFFVNRHYAQSKYLFDDVFIYSSEFLICMTTVNIHTYADFTKYIAGTSIDKPNTILSIYLIQLASKFLIY